jgi:hypothetical protein
MYRLLGSHSTGDDAAVPGTATQWWEWPHRAGGDWGDAPRWPYVTASSPVGAEWVTVPFRGCRRPLSRGQRGGGTGVGGTVS